MRKNLTIRRDLLPVGLLLLLGACELNPTIPSGRILDDQLKTPEAAGVIFNGLVGDLEYGVTRAIVHSALATSDEIGYSGTRLWYDMTYAGRPEPADVRVPYQNTARARWTAENGIAMLNEILPDPDQSPLITAAHVWAGYSLRVMGDLFCEAVFDAGPAEPNSAYYQRAINHFQIARDRAMAAGSGLDSLRLAAIAGMAQSYLILGDYSQAAQLASQVPDGFVWVAHHSSVAERERNFVWLESHTNRMLTVFGTDFAALGPEGDPRTRWTDAKRNGNDGKTRLYLQQKYGTADSDEPLAKGWEMRLIEAEVLLRSGNIPGFLAKVSQVRDAFGLGPVSAATTAEAWSVLDRERRATLWLEGRRLKDQHRFHEEGLRPFPEGRPTCLPFSDTEIAGNPNLR